MVVRADIMKPQTRLGAPENRYGVSGGGLRYRQLKKWTYTGQLGWYRGSKLSSLTDVSFSFSGNKLRLLKWFITGNSDQAHEKGVRV